MNTVGNIYYDSRTGNVKRFVQKICEQTGWQSMPIQTVSSIMEPGHLLTYTTQIGRVPDATGLFLKKWHRLILSVSSSGNRNWGCNFAIAAKLISAQYDIPILLMFELSGLDKDVNDFIDKVRVYANKEMDTTQ